MSNYPTLLSHAAPCGLTVAQARSDWVDAGKGLCIILVVMMHSVGGVGEALGGEGFLHEVVAFARPFRIPAFFLLAGLFLNRTIGGSWPVYADKKIVHFVYFYALWGAIQIGLKFGLTQGAGSAMHEFARAWVEPFGTLWFIYLLPIFFVAAKLLRRAPPALVLLGAALLEMAQIHTGWTAIDEFCARFIWFFAGYTLSAYMFEWAEMAREHTMSTLSFVAAFAMLNGFLVARGQASLPGISLFLGALGATALVASASLLASTSAGRLLTMAGRHSIVIYLAFFLPMIVMRLVLIKSGAAAHIGIGATSLIVWLAAVAIPLLIHAPTMRSPLRFLFQRPAWARWPAPAPTFAHAAE